IFELSPLPARLGSPPDGGFPCHSWLILHHSRLFGILHHCSAEPVHACLVFLLLVRGIVSAAQRSSRSSLRIPRDARLVESVDRGGDFPHHLCVRVFSHHPPCDPGAGHRSCRS